MLLINKQEQTSISTTIDNLERDAEILSPDVITVERDFKVKFDSMEEYLQFLEYMNDVIIKRLEYLVKIHGQPILNGKESNSKEEKYLQDYEMGKVSFTYIYHPEVGNIEIEHYSYGHYK